jgi:hypothetical protein
MQFTRMRDANATLSQSNTVARFDFTKPGALVLIQSEPGSSLLS